MSKRFLKGGTGDRRGFTAVEALISVVVMAILVLIVITMFQSSNKVSRRATTQPAEPAPITT